MAVLKTIVAIISFIFILISGLYLNKHKFELNFAEGACAMGELVCVFIGTLVMLLEA